MIYYYSLFTIFAIIITMMIIDQNVGDFIVLLSKIVRTKVERLYWMMRFHPVILSSPIGRWWMMRKYSRLVKEISEELQNTIDNDVNEKS